MPHLTSTVTFCPDLCKIYFFGLKSVLYFSDGAEIRTCDDSDCQCPYLCSMSGSVSRHIIAVTCTPSHPPPPSSVCSLELSSELELFLPKMTRILEVKQSNKKTKYPGSGQILVVFYMPLTSRESQQTNSLISPVCIIRKSWPGHFFYFSLKWLREGAIFFDWNR